MTSCQHGKRRRVRGGGFPGISLSSLFSFATTSARSKYKMTFFFLVGVSFFCSVTGGCGVVSKNKKNNNVSSFCARQLFLMGEKIHIGCLFSHVTYARENTLLTLLFPHFLSRIISSLLFLTHRRRKQNTFTQKKKTKLKKKNIKSSAKNVDELL